MQGLYDYTWFYFLRQLHISRHVLYVCMIAHFRTSGTVIHVRGARVPAFAHTYVLYIHTHIIACLSRQEYSYSNSNIVCFDRYTCTCSLEQDRRWSCILDEMRCWGVVTDLQGNDSVKWQVSIAKVKQEWGMCVGHMRDATL